MKIIKHGDEGKIKKHFKCKYCGCEFEANASECDKVVNEYFGGKNKIYYRCQCPECMTELNSDG